MGLARVVFFVLLLMGGQVFVWGVVPLQALALEGAQQELQKTVKRVYQAEKIQGSLPDGAEPVPVENQAPSGKPGSKASSFAGGFIQYILLACLVGILIVVLMHFKGFFWSDSRSRKILEEAETAPEAVSARMEQAGLEADDYARRGEFAEAMHVLLLQSLGEMRLHLGISIAVSLTSREILRAINLSPQAKQAFADIISRVEISYFGNHTPSADEYALCRQHFDVLSQALKNQGRG